MDAPVLTDELLDVEGVAALLSIHVNTVRRLYNREGLPYLRLGRSVRFRRRDIDKWLTTKSVNKE